MELEKFIQRSNKIHNNRYLYHLIPPDKKITTDSNCFVRIICPKHGEFVQRAGDHLRGKGCKQCSIKSASNKCLSWLDWIMSNDPTIFIQHAGNIGEYFIPELQKFADGYCKETNTVYEFDGDAFHGNLAKYAPQDRCHPYNKDITANELFNKTLEKHKAIIDAGYNLVTMWESDFDKMNIPIKNYTDINPSKIHSSYPEQLKNMGLEIIGEYTGSKNKHKLKCLVCGNIHEATPVSKIWSKKRYSETYGCPECNRQRITLINRQRGNYTKRLKLLNYSVYNYKNAITKATLICDICGKKKFVTPSAVIQRNIPCCERK